jgi:thiol-disulfide isomerase/thioredoxin
MQVNFSVERMRNLAIALVAIVLVVALSLGLRESNRDESLEAQARVSQPIDIALSNGKPTLVEFYADWCGVCQSMSQDLAAIKAEFGEKVNFSMLNVDNTKWLPEVTKYRVDGIPHFVFFDRQGTEIAQAVGDQPRTVLVAKLTDLIEGKISTSAQSSAPKGEVSQFKSKATNSSNDTPRAHGV